MKTLLTTLCLTIAVLLGSVGVSFALPKCEGSPVVGSLDQISNATHGWTECVGEIQLFDLFTYVGEWKDGKEHGHGTLTNSDGEKYVGGYKDGRRHGQGILRYMGEIVYEGTYKNGFAKPWWKFW